MTVRLLAIALVLALVGGGIAVVCAPAAPVAAEVDLGDGHDLEATAAHDGTLAATFEPRIVAVVAPPLVTLTPRHHLDPLFRPPRG